jgi:hypothetical protein
MCFHITIERWLLSCEKWWGHRKEGEIETEGRGRRGGGTRLGGGSEELERGTKGEGGGG